MNALQVDSLTKSIGDRILFTDVSFVLQEGDKTGIIAPNGTGKSTLLSIIAGAGEADSGTVSVAPGLRVGYLEQTPPFSPGQSVAEYMEELPHDAEDWNFPDRMRSLLTSLGITGYDRPMGELSGGQVKRVAMARVLLAEPDILLLDEPTNHLDIDVIEWLENRLRRQRVTLLMVTHDRYFLDRVCNRIIEIDGTHLYAYEGNYDYYLMKRQERHEAQSAELARVRNLLRTELEWMRRQPQARGSKAKYRIDNFHDLVARSRVQRRDTDVTLATHGSYIGSKIFEAVHVAKAFGDNVILRDWNYTFARYDKVGIIGRNGVGKSTLIKMLQGIVAPDSGHFDVGTTVKFGYYSQEGIAFDEKKRVIDAVREIAETVRIDDKTTLTVSQFLCHFLFPVPDQQKYIYKLSGGERRRLYLATVLMRNPNFLILDEPTNDLDIPTLAILEDYLSRFKGCVLIVSHDRYFLDRVAEHLFVMSGDGEIKDFPGDYSTYRHCLEQERSEQAEAERQRSAPAPRRLRQAKVRLTYKEAKEKEALEAELPGLEAEKTQLEQAMSSGQMSPQQIVDAGEKMQQLINEIDEKEMRLLMLMEKEEG